MSGPTIPSLRFGSIPGCSKPPITKNHSTILGVFRHKKDVVELDITMNPPMLVGKVDGINDLFEVVTDFGFGEALSSSGDVVVDSTTGTIFEDDVDVVGVVDDVEEANDPRGTEGLESLNLSLVLPFNIFVQFRNHF